MYRLHFLSEHVVCCISGRFSRFAFDLRCTFVDLIATISAIYRYLCLHFHILPRFAISFGTDAFTTLTVSLRCRLRCYVSTRYIRLHLHLL